MKHVLVLIFFLFLTPHVRAASNSEHTPRLLVHLLDYLAKDYGGAVSNGKILSQSEYHEQKEFSQSALETNHDLKETSKNPEIELKLQTLNKLINSKADAEKVSRLAREIQMKVIEVSGLEVSPTRWPSLSRGQKIFAQNCVACHGNTGAGDGPAGKALNPQPANFLDQHMSEISPFQAFNTIRLGVPGTGMAPFHSFSDTEVWDLAFYVVSLRHAGKAQTQSDSQSSWDGELLKQVATASDEKLELTLMDKDETKKASALVALRMHSDDDESGGGSLQIARTELAMALKDYKEDKKDSAKAKALKAYLEGIEPVEPRLRANDSELVSDLESKMAAVRSDIDSNQSVKRVGESVTVANHAIDQAEALLKGHEMSPWLAFLAAAAILFREGFEAVLIVIALLGVIRAAGSRKAALWVHGGWLVALGIGAIAWFFSGWLMKISGAQRETLEGATSLFAVVVLLIVGFWLHSQTEIGRWTAFIHGKVQRALEGKNLWALASISFIAVFREAFETVLFLRAIWLEGGDSSKVAMLTGVLLSLLTVIGMAWAILKFSAKLPIRNLFGISAFIMALLAVILTGKGLHSLQETGALSVSSSPHFIRFDLLGIYPTWETLLSQILILLAVFALWTWGKRPSPVRIGSPSAEI